MSAPDASKLVIVATILVFLLHIFSYSMSFDPSYMRYDGLNSVNYTLRAIDDEPLFTRLLVDLSGPRNKTEMKEHFMKQRQFF